MSEEASPSTPTSRLSGFHPDLHVPSNLASAFFTSNRPRNWSFKSFTFPPRQIWRWTLTSFLHSRPRCKSLSHPVYPTSGGRTYHSHLRDEI
ncbi:hypothetical protein GE21DRAFT_1079293 [Neurospora crassa]|nr:hypothetical protein GE21DRAFT_1079293 [Neurospora crassa]